MSKFVHLAIMFPTALRIVERVQMCEQFSVGFGVCVVSEVVGEDILLLGETRIANDAHSVIDGGRPAVRLCRR